MTSTQILIVGAGPIGLVTALSLHSAGIPAGDILIADSRPNGEIIETWSKALAMSASTVEEFRILGIAEQVTKLGIPLYQAHFGGGRRLLDLNYEVLGTKYPSNLYLAQEKTEAILLERCQEVGIQFIWDHAFTELQQTPDQVSATFKKVVTSTGASIDDESEIIIARWLIGCDGAHSIVREKAGITSQITKTTHYSWGVDVTVQVETPNLRTAQDAGGKAMLFRLSKDKIRFGANYEPREIIAGERPAPREEAYLRKWAIRNFGTDYGFDSIVSRCVVGTGMLIADTFRAGRVYIAGDAAHVLFPAGGQGMNTGILDATNLAWKLAMVATGRVTDPVLAERLLDSYTKERLVASRAVLKNIQVQMLSLFAATDVERAAVEFIAESLDEPAINRLWAARVTGFGDPVEPYHLEIDGVRIEDPLIGTRLTHIADEHEADILEATGNRTFAFALLDGQTFASENGQEWETVVKSEKYSNKVGIVEKALKPTADKWKNVDGILIRPDLRIAWVARKGDDAKASREKLEKTLSWWLGD